MQVEEAEEVVSGREREIEKEKKEEEKKREEGGGVSFLHLLSWLYNWLIRG